MAITFDASEVDALAVALGNGAARVGRDAARVVREAGRRVESAAKAAAPVRTGALRESISLSSSGDGRSAGMSAVVEAGIRYAVFNEFGTSKMAPQPFMGPALEGEAPRFAEEMGKLGGDLLA